MNTGPLASSFSFFHSFILHLDSFTFCAHCLYGSFGMKIGATKDKSKRSSKSSKSPVSADEEAPHKRRKRDDTDSSKITTKRKVTKKETISAKDITAKNANDITAESAKDTTAESANTDASKKSTSPLITTSHKSDELDELDALEDAVDEATFTSVDGGTLQEKRLKNAEAAKRCRERKKVQEQAKFRDLEDKLEKTKHQLQIAQSKIAELSAKNAHLRTQEVHMISILHKVQQRFKHTGDYICQLQAVIASQRINSLSVPQQAFTDANANHFAYSERPVTDQYFENMTFTTN